LAVRTLPSGTSKSIQLPFTALAIITPIALIRKYYIRADISKKEYLKSVLSSSVFPV